MKNNEKENRGLMTHELKAKFFYHGTSKVYFDNQVAKYGRYQNNLPTCEGEDTGLFVGTMRKICENYSQDRSKGYSTIPILLKIPAEPVRHRVHEHPEITDIVIDYLNLDEFKIIELKINLRR